MRLSNFINKFIFSVVFGSISIAFFMSLIFQYNNFKKDSLYIKNEYIKDKRNKLKNEIETIFKLIDNKEQVFQKLQEKIKKDYDLEKIKRDSLDETLNWLASYKVGEDGYIFVNTLDNKALIYDGKKLPKAIKYPSESIYKRMIKAANMPNGDFLFYEFKKLDTEKEFGKVAFVKVYKKYNWIIGTGAYLDDIEKEILRKEAIFKDSIKNQLKSFLLIFALMIIGVYITTKRLSKYIQKNIDNLTISFEKAAINNKKIDTNNLTFQEFIFLANNLNITLENKNYLEKELHDYISLVDEHVIISSTDIKGIILDVNEAFCKISAFSKEELVGNTHRLIRHPDTNESFYTQLWDILNNKEEWKGEIKNKDKNGKDYWVYAIIKPVFKNNELIGFTALRTNITDKKQVEQLAITDELTQLYNRRFFNTKIEEEIIKAKKENTYFSLLILDVDFFKEYNDTYGHQKGDEALKEIAIILKKDTSRSNDYAFRLGGEEFGIITTLDKVRVIEFAQHIKDKIEQLQIEHISSCIGKYLTISIGITSRKGADIINSESLYKQADDALYKSKGNGRNCIYLQK